jgi:hypothetical protein
VNGSFGVTENNLDENQLATQRRLAGSLNLNISVIKNLNLNLGYNSFASNVVAVRDIFYDSIRLTQVNQTGNFSANYSFGKNWKQSFNLTSSYQESGGNKTPLNSVFMLNPSYNLTITKTKTTLTSAMSLMQNPTLGIQQGFFKDKLKSGANFTIQDSRKNNELTNYNIASTAFLNYSFLKGHSLKMTYSYIYRKAVITGAQNFKENRLMVNYSYSFSSGYKKIKEKIKQKNAKK